MSVNLKPMSLGDIINYTFRILWRRLFTFYKLMAWIYIPLGLLFSLFSYLFMWEPFFSSLYDIYSFSFENILRMYAFFILYSIIQQALYPLAQGGVIMATAGNFYEREVTFREAIGQLFSNSLWLKLIILGLAISISVFFGSLFFILPGIFLSIVFYLAINAAVLEGKSPWSAMVRSWELVFKDFGKVFLIFLLMGIITSIITTIFLLPNFLISIVSIFLNWDISILTTVMSFLVVVLEVFAAPIPVIASTLLYLDLRMRHEGTDLEQRIGQVSREGNVYY